ncbi:28.3 kd protein c21orf2, partial [Giardia duodenalis]
VGRAQRGVLTSYFYYFASGSVDTRTKPRKGATHLLQGYCPNSKDFVVGSMTPAQNRIQEVYFPITASMKWRAIDPSIFCTICTDLDALTMQLSACLSGKGLCPWPDERNVKHHERYFDSIIQTYSVVLSHLSSVRQMLIHMHRHLIAPHLTVTWTS